MGIYIGSKEDIADHTRRRDGHKAAARKALADSKAAEAAGDTKRAAERRAHMFTYSRMAAQTTRVALGAIRIGEQEAELAENRPGREL